MNYIFSEKILRINFQEKRIMNIDEGGLIPLKVTPSFDVYKDIEFDCNSNIWLKFTYSQNCYDIKSKDSFPKIPAGTKKGTEIKFNCFTFAQIYNQILILMVNEQFYKSDHTGYYENMKWIADENNDKIEFIPNLFLNHSI